MIVTHFPWFPRVDGRYVGHFIQPFEKILERNEVAYGCHRMVPEKLVDRSSSQVVLDTPVR
jgi:hypothetical protein